MSLQIRYYSIKIERKGEFEEAFTKIAKSAILNYGGSQPVFGWEDSSFFLQNDLYENFTKSEKIEFLALVAKESVSE